MEDIKKFISEERIKLLNEKFKYFKKYFVQTNEKTKKYKLESFSKVVSKILVVSEREAIAEIEEGNVTINGDLVLDKNTVLKVGDVIRTYIGHFINGSQFIGIIEA